MDLFNQTNSSKDDDDTNLNDEEFRLYEEKLTTTIKDENNNEYEAFSNINTTNNTSSNTNYSKLILNENKPFSYYLKLYNKKQMLELDNPTFLSNQYKKQFKLTNKLARANNNLANNTKTSEKYKTSNESINSSSKKSDDGSEMLKDFIRFKKKSEDAKINTYNNLTQKLVQEHKKFFSYNSYQNPNTLKHFIVHTTKEETSNLDTEIEIDIIGDIKNNSSDRTDQTDEGLLANELEFMQEIPPSESAGTKSTKPMNKLLKNLKQRFNFKKNIVDIKLPTSIAEDESPTPLTQPNNSRQSIRSATSTSKPLITIESKKLILHQQPYVLVDKATSTSEQAAQQQSKAPLETPYRLPPPQNREMLSRIYNACNRKLKKPKNKVQIENENRLEISEKMNTNSNEAPKITNKPRRLSKKQIRSKPNESLFKVDSVSSFASINYTVSNETGARQSYKLKTNNIQLHPVLRLDPANFSDPMKESIRNYRLRLENINQNLNNLNLVSNNTSQNGNNFCVTEFMNEITTKNVSEPEVKTEHNRFKREKIKYTSQFNSSSTKSISVIDLTDLTEQPQNDLTKRPYFNSFRPMKLNEYVKNSNLKHKTLASIIISTNNNNNSNIPIMNSAKIGRAHV